MRINARNGVAAKAAADPNPPLDIPAKITAGMAKAKKCASNNMRVSKFFKGRLFLMNKGKLPLTLAPTDVFCSAAGLRECGGRATHAPEFIVISHNKLEL